MTNESLKGELGYTPKYVKKWRVVGKYSDAHKNHTEDEPCTRCFRTEQSDRYVRRSGDRLACHIVVLSALSRSVS